jgi:hypothetical protein
MMRRYQYASDPRDQRDQEVRRLKDELDDARRTILSLMPDAVHGELSSYSQCESRAASCRWLEDVAARLIERVEATQRSAYHQPRAPCPLCDSSPNSPYDEGGFTVPEGLRRHLVGWGNVSQCDVTEAAWHLARDYWDWQWRQTEVEEEAKGREQVAERRRTEVLYKTRPDREPELRDQAYEPRPASDWSAAEERLRALGFVEAMEGSVKAYTRDHDDCLVYADPRSKGRIEFVVCPKPLPKRYSRKSRYYFRQFSLLDSWKNDLEGKYQLRLRPPKKE